ncbi:thioredoxin family protein [Bacillus sp. 165]|uniref:thioredoxin family protein n=1 Tax=Bacillus sp. 165 TaxID=1529117 RepID=UPI001FFDEE10|nr:thioredoxin family protein [Bacillus sp. 165]
MIKSMLVPMDTVPQVAAEYLVFTAPALLFFVGGKEVSRHARFIKFEDLEREFHNWKELTE